VCVCVILTAI